MQDFAFVGTTAASARDLFGRGMAVRRFRHVAWRAAPFVLLPFMVGCPEPEPPPEPGNTITIPRPEPPWRQASLTSQPRLEMHRAMTPADMDWAPGSTRWRTIEIPRVLRHGDPEAEGRVSPGALLWELAETLALPERLGTDTWEITARVVREDVSVASGTIMRWEFQDDSVAGADHLVAMAQFQGLWYVERLSERFHCRRGVTDEGLCI